jgi:hypothetical protein
METAAQNFENVTISEITEVPLNYGSVSMFNIMDTSAETVLASADTNEEFFKQAFSLKLNDYSAPIVLSGDIAVLQYTESVEKEASEEEEDQSGYGIYISQIDQSSSQAILFNSPKLENNFITVYFENFLNYNY